MPLQSVQKAKVKRKIRSVSSPRKLADTLKLIPGYDPWRDAGDCRLDEKAAVDAIEFFPACLKHIEGELAGQPFALEPWQQAIIGNTFGWKRPDGTRRYRVVSVFVPGKNGKTPLAAGMAIYVWICDREPGAQVVNFAYTRDQAGLLWRWTRGFIESEHELSSRVNIYKSTHTMNLKENEASFFKTIACEDRGVHGLNLHAAIGDELHAIKDAEAVRVIKTRFASRTNPLLVFITTAGWDRHSICYEEYIYASKVRDGVVRDPYYLPIIYEAAEGDDWTDPKVWAKANPNLEKSVKIDYLKERCERAKKLPADENTFRQLHLNQWTEQAVRWIPMRAWDACDEPLDMDFLKGRLCIAGLDLASVRDTTALQLVFPVNETKKFHILTHIFIPEDGAREREDVDQVPYREWASRGWVTMTPGSATDYEYVYRKFAEYCGIYRVHELVYDAWSANTILNRIVKDMGFPEERSVKHRQGVSMSEPAKLFEGFVLKGQIVHGNNPVLRAQVSGAMIKKDQKENLELLKVSSQSRIDAVVATVMAIGRAALHLDDDTYADTGPMILGW